MFSYLILDGNPYSSTPDKNPSSTVFALFLEDTRIKNQTGVSINATVNDEAPPGVIFRNLFLNALSYFLRMV